MQRLRDSADERRGLLQVTADGRALKQRALDVPQAVAAASGYALDELSSLTARPARLRDDLNAAAPRKA